MGLLFLMGGLSLISMHKIVRCSQYLATIIGDQTLDYGDMASEACKHSFSKFRRHGKIAKWIVNGSLLTFQLGVLSVCFVFISDHIIEIIQYFNNDKPVPLSSQEIMLIYFFPQLLLSFIGNIKLITYLSLAGNFIIFTAIALIIKELLTHTHYKSSELPWITDLNGISLSAGALIYSFEGQAMVLPLENSLRHGEDMRGLTGVLSTAMNLVILFYAFLGFFGYLTFGSETLGSLTLNLPNNLMSVIVKILLVMKVFFGSALQLYVIVEMLWPIISQKIERKWLLKLGPYFLRAALTLFSLSLAISVPNLANIIPLVGITSGMLLSLILPSCLDSLVFLYYLHKKGYKFQFYAKLIENAILFVLGWFFLVTGLQSTIQQLAHGS
ncbi:hypothetical protein WR25_19094 [Diploscapter pachys]|uniref:Amino acid transporter transmembrane domain-containing protein n=1 Tax=Diploscapter pachys TaxID=2018661 RepID=A0A2A2LND3_9BILA|nr:hypothetical protein WR25_19094 [Diploscapter pachys]